MSQIVEGLREARRLVEAGWTQGVWARSSDGIVCGWLGDDAACFCPHGAVERVFYAQHDACSSARGFLENAGLTIPFNDSVEATKEVVMAKFDDAIALASGAAQEAA